MTDKPMTPMEFKLYLAKQLCDAGVFSLENTTPEKVAKEWPYGALAEMWDGIKNPRTREQILSEPRYLFR